MVEHARFGEVQKHQGRASYRLAVEEGLFKQRMRTNVRDKEEQGGLVVNTCQ